MGKQAKLGTFAGGAADETIEGEKVQGPYDLPEGWKWIKLKDIVVRVQYGLSKAMNSEGIGLPIIRMNNLTYDGFLDLSDLKYVNIDDEIANKYMLERGDILFNRTNSRELVGKTAVFNQDSKFVFASYLIRVVVDRSKAIPEYIGMYLNSKRMKEVFFRMARPAVQMANINAKELCDIEIPLPPLEEQRRIVSRIEQLVNRAEEAKRLRKQAREEAEKIMQAALNKVFSRAEEEGWEWAELGEVCEINPAKHEIKNLPDNMQVTFVPMSAVSEVTGKIERPEIRLLGEVRKGYTYFKEGDVLFAKITPCMENGKSAIARGLINGIGFGSTEFHILRPSSKVHAEWIYFYIRQKSFRDEAAKNMTGSVGQQRVPVEFLRKVMIPLPSLEKQKMMIDYLDKISEIIESLKKLQQRTEEELEKLIPAILDRAFKGEL
jgi:type I restriction enzyme S subunit